MTKVNELLGCQRCGSDLPEPKPEFCPKCHSYIAKVSSTIFGEPDYLTFQIQEYIEDLKNAKTKDLGTTGHNKKAAATEELIRFYRESGYSNTSACLMDGKGYMMNLIQSKLNRTEIMEVVKLAKAIGALGEVVEKYLAADGEAHVRRFDRIQTDEGDARGGAATAAKDRI
jgi:hypothetical protein